MLLSFESPANRYILKHGRGSNPQAQELFLTTTLGRFRQSTAVYLFRHRVYILSKVLVIVHPRRVYKRRTFTYR